MSTCPCPSSQYFYHASAYGFAAELHRPIRHSVGTQAATVLGADGGRSSTRVRDFTLDGFISVKDAHTEVGGSYDECHRRHTTYAYSSLEGVNIGDVLTADRIVSRIYIYAPPDSQDAAKPKLTETQGKGQSKGQQETNELSFTITGSHFENLRIAGYKANVQLPASVFHGYDTYSKACGADAKWMLGSKLADLGSGVLQDLENTYHALKGMTGLISGWKQEGGNRTGAYFLSPANEFKLEGYSQSDNSDIKVYGNMVFIPKFGVIRLAELVVHRNCRNLIMFRVQMCSGHDAGASGGGTMGGGGSQGGGG